MSGTYDDALFDLCDLVDSDECSPQCLFSAKGVECACRCNGLFHGLARETSNGYIAPPTQSAPPPPIPPAAAALQAILSSGPVPAKAAIRAMAAAGFSKDQAKRAKRRLGVRSTKTGWPGEPWTWDLAR